MPNQINQIQLNSEDPADSYDRLTANFYHNLASAARDTIPEFDVLRDRHTNAFHNIMLDDQMRCHSLEDRPDYRAAIDPQRIQAANMLMANINANQRQLSNPNLSEEQKAELRRQIANAQAEYTRLHLEQIHDILEKYVALQQEALVRLQVQQTQEYNDFNAQLNAYIAQFPANEQPAKQQFADSQREAFLAYQQQQLNHLKTLYEERQENFLTRVNEAERDLSILRSNGKTAQQAREALVQPSTYGNGLSPEKASSIKREYYSIPCGPKAEDRIQYSITLQGTGSQQTANVRFDTINIPFQYRVDAWNTAFDKLLAEGKNHFDLMSCKRSFPINERYPATMRMIKHIWEINPDATIEPGELPGKDPIPGGNNHTGYYKEFINLQRDVAAKKQLQKDSRIRNGFPAEQPEPVARVFEVPQLARPGNAVNPLEIERDLGQGIQFGPPINRLANGAGNPNNDQNDVGAQEMQFNRPGLRGRN